jgi:hypothetical protein
MDYNFDLDDEKYLWADEILSWIEDDYQIQMDKEEEDLLEIE